MIAAALTAIENSYDVLLAMPQQDSVRFFSVEHHRRAAESGDAERASKELLSDVFNFLKFFWWTSAFKARQLTAALVHAYNTDNYLAWLILGRSSLEYAAVSHFFAKRILQRDWRGPAFAASEIKAIEDLLLRYAHGSRFNWADLLAGDRQKLGARFTPPASTTAVNVMSALDDLAKRDARYTDVRIGYEMLSDFAHPNMASHCSVIEMPKKQSDFHQCEISATPGALRGEFLMVASLPWVSTGVGATVEVLVEMAPVVDRWLSLFDGIEKISLDFTR